MFRGSRKHVLDWLEQPAFAVQMQELVAPAPVHIDTTSKWMPRSREFAKEARLDKFGPSVAPDKSVWMHLKAWWLAHFRCANTPNWDLAMWCTVEERPGLILVEAKANTLELKVEGKPIFENAAQNTRDNHEQIRRAILEGRDGLRRAAGDTAIQIDIEKHYQLSNRLAFAWKLASLGVPTVLVYLGFTGDEGIRDVGPPFADDADWRRCFHEHAAGIIPPALFDDRRLLVGATPLWLQLRSRAVIEPSSILRARHTEGQ